MSLLCIICGKPGYGHRLNKIWLCEYHLKWLDDEISNWNDYYEVLEKSSAGEKVVYSGLKFAADIHYRAAWSDVFQKSDPEDYNTANLSDEDFDEMVTSYLDLYADGDDELKVYYLRKVQNGSGS